MFNKIKPLQSRLKYPFSFAIMMVSMLFVSPSSNATAEVKITLSNATIKQFQVLQDTFRYTRTTGKKLGRLPVTEFNLVISDDGRALPSSRGLHVTKNKYWDIIFEPGTWYLRNEKVSIVLPFALVEKNANCTHQGILIIENGSAGYQIASETCQYFQFNALGRTDVKLVPILASDNSNEVVESFLTEINNRLKEAPLKQSVKDYPNLNPSIFSQSEFVKPDSMTAYGAVLERTHYVSDCPTRVSTFPDCSHMPLPAYSLAKSLIGGIGLMRLEALYPGVKDIRVKDLIPDCSMWGEIKLKHLLNNTTGRYGSSQPHRDEDKHLLPFLKKNSVKAKTKHVCNRYSVKEEPGQQWVYHTTEFWLLGVAMQNFWRQKNSEDSDFYDDILTPLWSELGLSPVLTKPHRQEDQPLTGWGLMLLRSDIAKIGNALTSENSIFTKYLDRHMFNKAMQADSNDRGSVAGSENLRFKNGFWAWNASSSLECTQEKWLPFMSGYGGISVVLLPDGDVYYYFSDGGVFRFTDVIQHLNKTRSIC